MKQQIILLNVYDEHDVENGKRELMWIGKSGRSFTATIKGDKLVSEDLIMTIEDFANNVIERL